MAGNYTAKARKAVRESLQSARMISWGEALARSFRFCVMPRRWAPFFVLDMAAVSLVLFLLGTVPLEAVTMAETGLPPSLIVALSGMALVGAAWFLLTLWVAGALIHQSGRPGEFRQSWSVAFRRVPSLLGAAILVGLISFAVSIVPYAGTVLAFLVSIAFLLIYQFIVIGGKGFVPAMSGSLRTFRVKAFTMFVAWLLSAVIAALISIVAAAPLLGAFLYQASIYGYEYALAYMLMFMDRTLLYLGGAVVLIGTSIAKAFGLKFLTEVYLQMTRKKFIVF